MLPPEEGMLFTQDPEVVSLSSRTGSTTGASSSVGTNTMQGSSSASAYSTSASESTNSMDTVSASSSDTIGESDAEGWGVALTEGGGIAHQTGESESFSTGRNWNEIRGTTTTDSESITEGFGETHGETVTEGQATTTGETNTRGESTSLAPFYEYIREEIETPVFMSPEEQRLLVKQRLKRVLKAHILVIPPDRPDCILTAPFVDTVTIGAKRLNKDLMEINAAAANDRVSPDVIDVEVRVIAESQPLALPSPAPEAVPVDPEVEAALWESWTARSRAYKG